MTTKRRGVDEWEVVSGLPDDFDGVIKTSRFGYMDNYQNGEVALLIWDIESPDVEEQVIIWPCGKGWVVKDRGKRVEHPKRQQFVDTSAMGRLIVRVTKELKIDMRSRGSAQEAAIWEGLGFHFKREEFKLPEGAKERGLPEKVVHLMPVEVLEGQSAEPTAPRTRRAATQPEEKAQEAVSDGLTRRLTALAKRLDLKAFQDRALDMDEFKGSDNTDLLTDILDDSEKGFWARARAES